MALIKLNSRAIPDDTVIASDIADGSISTAKLAADAVTNAKLAADAVTTAKIANTVNLGRRNLIHNGGFDIWQRGLTVTNAAIDTYTVDRWKQWASSGAESGRATYSKQIITDLEGFAHALKIAVTTAQTSIGATDAYQLQTRLEKKDVDHIGIGTASAKPFTISFYAKASSGFKLAVQVGTYGGGQYLEEFDVTTSWQRFEFNIAAQTNATYVTSQTDYTDWSIQTGIALMAGSSR